MARPPFGGGVRHLAGSDARGRETHRSHDRSAIVYRARYREKRKMEPIAPMTTVARQTGDTFRSATSKAEAFGSVQYGSPLFANDDARCCTGRNIWPKERLAIGKRDKTLNMVERFFRTLPLRPSAATSSVRSQSSQSRTWHTWPSTTSRRNDSSGRRQLTTS